MAQWVTHRYDRGRAEPSGHPLRTKGEKCRGYFPGLGCRLHERVLHHRATPSSTQKHQMQTPHSATAKQARPPTFCALTGPHGGQTLRAASHSCALASACGNSANQPDFALIGPRLLTLALPVGHHSFSLLLLDHHRPPHSRTLCSPRRSIDL